MDTKPTRTEQEDRRRTAVRKVAAGRSCTDVADFLGVHVDTVRRWVRAHKAGGDAGLAGTPHPGRKPFPTPAQQAEDLGWLARKPTELGFRTDLQTAARVAQLVQEKFGVAYHPSYLCERTTAVGGDGGHRTEVPVIGAVTVSPVAHRLGFYLATAADGYFGAWRVVAFLRNLLRHLPGKVVVTWDGGGNRKGPVVQDFLRRNERLRLERLPAYCPDLNPAQAVWSWLKWGRLANYVHDALTDLDDWAVEVLVELKDNPRGLRASWARSDVPFPATPVMQPGQPASQ